MSTQTGAPEMPKIEASEIEDIEPAPDALSLPALIALEALSVVALLAVAGAVLWAIWALLLGAPAVPWWLLTLLPAPLIGAAARIGQERDVITSAARHWHTVARRDGPGAVVVGAVLWPIRHTLQVRGQLGADEESLTDDIEGET